MQNQPGSDRRKHDPADASHDRQAAGLSEDVFKGGKPAPGPRPFKWLRSPWKPAAGRLWPRRERSEDEL